MGDFNAENEIRKMLDGLFEDVAGNAMEQYAASLFQVFTSFTKAGFADDHAIGFAQIMFADDVKRVRDKYEGGQTGGMGFNL